MGRVGVGLGIDRDGVDAEPASGGEHAAGDLATIGDQDRFEHGFRPHIRKTPKRVSGIGAFSEAEMDRPRTSRVWAGSMTPSSHRRAVAK